jgi:hypothetical protein
MRHRRKCCERIERNKNNAGEAPRREETGEKFCSD